MRWMVIAAVVLPFFLLSCGVSGGEVYKSGKLYQVEYGEIVKKRAVRVGDEQYGKEIAGALLGGYLGYEIATANAYDALLPALAGAVGGSVLGDVVDEDETEGYEYVIRRADESCIAIILESNYYRIGDYVALTKDGDRVLRMEVVG